MRGRRREWKHSHTKQTVLVGVAFRRWLVHQAEHSGLGVVPFIRDLEGTTQGSHWEHPLWTGKRSLDTRVSHDMFQCWDTRTSAVKAAHCTIPGGAIPSEFCCTVPYSAVHCASTHYLKSFYPWLASQLGYTWKPRWRLPEVPSNKGSYFYGWLMKVLLIRENLSFTGNFFCDRVQVKISWFQSK